MAHNFEAQTLNYPNDAALDRVDRPGQVSTVVNTETIGRGESLESAVSQTILNAAFADVMSRMSGVPAPQIDALPDFARQTLEMASVPPIIEQSAPQEVTPTSPEGYTLAESFSLLDINGTVNLRSEPNSRGNTLLFAINDQVGILHGAEVIAAPEGKTIEPGFRWYYIPNLPDGSSGYVALTNRIDMTETDEPVIPVETPAAAPTPIGTVQPPETDPTATQAPGFGTETPATPQAPELPTGPAVAPTESRRDLPESTSAPTEDVPDFVLASTPEAIKSPGSGWQYNEQLLSWTSEITTPNGEKLTRVFRPFSGETVELDDVAGAEITVQEVLHGQNIEFVFEWNTLSERSPYSRISFGEADRAELTEILESQILEIAPFLQEKNITRVILTTISASALTDDFSLRSDVSSFRDRSLDNSTFKPTYLDNGDGTKTLQITFHDDARSLTDLVEYAMFYGVGNLVYCVSIEQAVVDGKSFDISEEEYLTAAGNAQNVSNEIYLTASHGETTNPFPPEYK